MWLLFWTFDVEDLILWAVIVILWRDWCQIGSVIGSVVPAGNGSGRVHQVVLEGNQYGLGSIPGPKFAEKTGHSVFDRVDGEMQLVSNLLIAESSAETP